VKVGLRCIILLGAFIATTAPAIAHPLGNFTINHLVKVQPRPGAVRVRYILDVAELPTFQIMREVDTSGNWSGADLSRWRVDEASLVATGLTLKVDGRPAVLTLVSTKARIRPGAGGLPLLYWVGDFLASVTRAPHRVQVHDATYADRQIGWKDVVVAPEGEPTHELLAYPSVLLGSPRRIDSARFAMRADGRAEHVTFAEEASPYFGNGTTSLVRSNALTDMFSSRDRSPLFVVMTILVAFGLGALHALEPGHGKALLAFTLVGSRATMKQAAVLAASLTLAHTIAVFALGFALFFATGLASESLYPWITLVSGAAIAMIGARSLARYLAAQGLHIHDGHTHGAASDHHHGEGHPHAHGPPGSSPLTFRTAIWAAISGGIAPCPAAIVVLLAALRLHQLGYGMFLIVVFSLGLAGVLTGLGIAVVHGAGRLAGTRRFDRFAVHGPLLSALLISGIGAVMVGQSFVEQGIAPSAWIASALVAFAIAGYALTPQHRHQRAEVA
jgi:nickel/cobalt exporter